MGALERFRQAAGRLNQARLFILDQLLHWRGEVALYLRRRRFERMKARSDKRDARKKARREQLQKELDRALRNHGGDKN